VGFSSDRVERLLRLAFVLVTTFKLTRKTKTFVDGLVALLIQEKLKMSPSTITTGIGSDNLLLLMFNSCNAVQDFVLPHRLLVINTPSRAINYLTIPPHPTPLLRRSVEDGESRENI